MDDSHPVVGVDRESVENGIRAAAGVLRLHFEELGMILTVAVSYAILLVVFAAIYFAL